MSKAVYELSVNSADKFIAKQVNDADMEIWLAEMMLRARRKVGEISKELDKAQGKRNDKQLSHSAGLTKQVANRCEKIAEIPEEKFEAVISEAKERTQKTQQEQS